MVLIIAQTAQFFNPSPQMLLPRRHSHSERKKPGARRRRWGEPLYVRLVVNGGYGRSPRIERGEGRYSRFARERRGARGERCFCRLCTLRRSSELPNIGAPQLPLPTAKKGTRLGAFWWWEEDTYCRNPARGVPSAKRRGAKGEWCSRQLFTLRRSPELPNVGASQLPLPTAKKRHPHGCLLVVGRGRFELPKS